MRQAFAYLRVSGKGQVHGDGFPRQRTAIQRYAKAQDIQIVREFCEEGVSGTADGPDRPAWVSMVAAMLANGVRTVIVEKLDRLARQQGLQEYMLYDMQRRGITILSTQEDDLDETDPTRVLFRQLIGAIAQYEKSMIVLKLRGARKRVKAKEGRCEGRKPYGTREGEQAVLDRIKSLRADGIAYDKIAAHLNAEGLKPRSGEKWHAGVIHRILNAAG